MHILNQSRQIESIYPMITRPKLSVVTLISQPAFLEHPVLTILIFFPSKLKIDYSILFINFFVLSKDIPSKVWISTCDAWWTLPTLFAMMFVSQTVFLVTLSGKFYSILSLEVVTHKSTAILNCKNVIFSYANVPLEISPC